MEPDGFAYDGAAVYDLEQRTYLRIFGQLPDEGRAGAGYAADLSRPARHPRGRHHHHRERGADPMRSTLPFPDEEYEGHSAGYPGGKGL